MRPTALLLTSIAWALASGPVPAETPVSRQALAERAAQRFPQPVRVGDLVGRCVFQPDERQAVLGTATGVAKGTEGLDLVVRVGGWFGLGGRIVTVPVEAVALLGEHLALLDIDPDRFEALPGVDPAALSVLSPNATIRLALTGPFH